MERREKRGPGRPRLVVPRTKTSLALTEDVRALLQALAEKLDASQAAVVEQAVRELAARQGIR